MASTPVITPELIRQLIRFDEKTGKYFWKARPREMFRSEQTYISWHTRFCGKETFIEKTPDGYRRASVFGRRYRAHRLIWAIHYGTWPNGQIDHINGKRDDNRIENLRDVTATDNTRNRHDNALNTSGQMGVCWNKAKEKWRVTIGAGGKRIHIGEFREKSEAVAARKKAELLLGYHPNHGSSL